MLRYSVEQPVQARLTLWTATHAADSNP